MICRASAPHFFLPEGRLRRRSTRVIGDGDLLYVPKGVMRFRISYIAQNIYHGAPDGPKMWLGTPLMEAGPAQESHS